ncbi:galactose mutarotase [Leptotrichia sp. OH3620_COT-345]|uniref:aldose epimerase family protein n=1 Tax=Leptotrichia sp. OH3620_COT-345 TaxID=2491048 RepID=UPI000F6559B9|nr:aldose epimerase family protein [Leptotrichia sp. OH3620_COT-345]RRD40064.1 galactose mutarotase [Leptotrichia sp. OH3620_COT-345]
MISVEKKLFGIYKGEKIFRYELKNSNGFQVNILNLGGIITGIYVKDKKGNIKNTVLGYQEIEKYIGNSAYPGAIIGRTAGRIKNGEFSIDGVKYSLGKNDGKNSLHGGKEGLNDKIYNVKELGNGIELSYISPHMEEGYPGTVEFKILYLINENNGLSLEYNAVSDRKTYINLTNHTYFNLSGNLEKNGDEQILKIKADNVCELGSGLIPTGNFISVENTVFDFREGLKIKDGIEKGHSQFKITRAYDHPFILNYSGVENEPQIILYSEYSGIEMEIRTTERSVVIYTGNYLDDVSEFQEEKGQNRRYLGVTIETQDFPDGINIKNFNVKPLKAGEKYYSKTTYKFNIV